MEQSYWHDKWESADTAFHQSGYNGQMLAHFPSLNLAKGASVFVPLCGKTRDIAWLLEQGYAVSGAELSETAVVALFEDLGIAPKISVHGALTLYCSERLAIWVGDIFALTAADLGAVDAIYDRAALVALPDEMRARYVAHLMEITGGARQLLLTFAYDQSKMAGPPFSNTADMVQGYYRDHFTVSQVGASEIPPPGLKGRVAATELAFLLT